MHKYIHANVFMHQHINMNNALEGEVIDLILRKCIVLFVCDIFELNNQNPCTVIDMVFGFYVEFEHYQI